MELVREHGTTGAVAGLVLVLVAALIWLASRRPQAYRRLLIWIILLPQLVALGFALWNEGLRQARAIVAVRAKAPERDTIMQLIDGKMAPEWLVLAVPFAVVCFALLLSFLPDLLREDGRAGTRKAD
jgi:hypothetical protein